MIDLTLSNSKIKTYRRCPNQYRYKYVDKIEPKRKKIQLERGSWVHDLLQHHYDGEDWIARHKQLIKEYYASTFEEEREDMDLGSEITRIMRSYMSHWKKTDSGLFTVDTEVNEVLTLPSGLKFNFIIDWIVEDLKDGGLWIVDHKTGKNFLDADFILLDAQLTRYFWGAEQMGYTPLRGVIFNEIRTKPPTEPEVLKSGRLTQRANLDSDYHTYYRAIRRLGQDPVLYRDTLKRLSARGKNFFRRTQLPKDSPVTRTMMREMGMTANEILRAERKRAFPRSVSKECTWDCDYKDLCVVELMGGDISSMVKHQFQPRKRRPD